MGDIAVATKVSLSPAQSDAAHVTAVTEVLKVALENNLYFKPEKCVFHATSIDYLGVILEKGVTCMDPVKISGIKDWPTPRDCHGYTRGNPWAFKRAQEEPKRISNEGDMVQILF
jgi:hypothetical protein